MLGPPVSVYSIKSASPELMTAFGTYIASCSGLVWRRYLWDGLQYSIWIGWLGSSGLILAILCDRRPANNIRAAFVDPVKPTGEFSRSSNQDIASVDNRKPAVPRLLQPNASAYRDNRHSASLVSEDIMIFFDLLGVFLAMARKLYQDHSPPRSPHGCDFRNRRVALTYAADPVIGI
jgi:hypothetical protein